MAAKRNVGKRAGKRTAKAGARSTGGTSRRGYPSTPDEFLIAVEMSIQSSGRSVKPLED